MSIMTTTSSSTHSAVRLFSYGYVILICVCWFLDNYLGASHFNWFMAVSILFCLAAARLHKSAIDKIAGLFITVGSIYMFLAVISAHSRAVTGSHPEAAANVLRFGIPVFALSFAAGNILLLLAFLAPGNRK
jgi:hypothetical protein